MESQSIHGTWKLSGSPEMVCMFRFEKNGKFSFTYIYGAVDRNAEGTYSIEGDTIKLQSMKPAGEDVVVVKSEKREGNITIQVVDQQQFLTQYAIGHFMNDGKHDRVESDSHGRIVLPVVTTEKVWVSNDLFPDVPSMIRDVNDSNTYFEVSFKPSLAEVSFKGIDLFIKDDHLTCLPNSLLPILDAAFYKMN